MSWQNVKLGEILNESKIICLNPNPDRRIKVRLKVLGVEKRGLENEIEGATKQYIRKAGQFIYGKQNFHKGAFGVIPKELDGFESSADLPAFDVSQNCLPEWVLYFFKQGNYYLELVNIARGVATQRIHPEQIYDLEIPLPDIKTQRSILSKIGLLESTGLGTKAELNYQQDLVNQLRKAFLREAMQGKLVKQDKKEGNAKDLLQKIKAEKARSEKKEKEIPPLKPEEVPFEIPENWVWCRLEEVCMEIVDCPHSTPKYLPNDTGYYGIDTTCIDDAGKILRLRNLSKEGYNERIKRLIPKENDIIYAREGSIGLSAFIPPDKNICLGQRVMLFRASSGIYNTFLKMVVTDETYKNRLLEKHRGMGAKHVNVKDIVFSLIPLPPVAEQKRIVEKLENLMKLCDELQQNIEQSKEQNKMLLQQVLSEALQHKEQEVEV